MKRNFMIILDGIIKYIIILEQKAPYQSFSDLKGN